jgi:hypothetical protein
LRKGIARLGVGIFWKSGLGGCFGKQSLDLFDVCAELGSFGQLGGNHFGKLAGDHLERPGVEICEMLTWERVHFQT